MDIFGLGTRILEKREFENPPGSDSIRDRLGRGSLLKSHRWIGVRGGSIIDIEVWGGQ